MKTAKKILLVDDDTEDGNFFLAALQEIDPVAECIIVKDGKHALDLLDDPEFTLPNYIFLDLLMPGITGKQCLMLLKQSARLKSIPVIIYTSSREVSEAEELYGLGASHFISKPNNPNEIYYLLSMVLEEKWNALTWIN
jgi:CheY-like chemotaxis protein